MLYCPLSFQEQKILKMKFLRQKSKAAFFFFNSEAKILADINFLAGIKFVGAYWFKTAQNVILDSWDETPCLLII